MALLVDIGPEVQAELLRRATANGNRVEAYAARLLEEAVRVPASQRHLGEDRLESILREMAQFSHKIPSLPDSAFTRESLYQDHD